MAIQDRAATGSVMTRDFDVVGSERPGLKGRRERTDLRGGSFEVRSAPGHGSTVLVCWPLAPRLDR
jgi:glucose-6-phosphate-specific signal transduction histidine kinase